MSLNVLQRPQHKWKDQIHYVCVKSLAWPKKKNLKIMRNHKNIKLFADKD